MKHIIFDCDNTFGVEGCDVDDGRISDASGAVQGLPGPV